MSTQESGQNQAEDQPRIVRGANPLAAAAAGRGERLPHQRRGPLSMLAKYVFIAFFVAYRGFTTEEHVGLTFENMKRCVLDEVVTLAPGEHCMSFKRDFWLVTLDVADFALHKVGLQQQSTKSIIQHYEQEEKKIKVKPNCTIGAGYTVCTDINFNAVDFFEEIEGQVREIEKKNNRPVQPTNHPHITDGLTFIETFLHYFINGANSERVTENEEMFFDFVKLLKNIPHREELGGNSAQFIARAQIYGCTVYSAAQDKNRIGDWLKKDGTKGKLIWPKEAINKIDGESNKNTIDDTHLVFEYKEGDSLLGGRFKAPRSNRFYFVHDPNGGKIQQLETYHQILKDNNKLNAKVNRHMFGGHQLMQRLSPEEAENRFKRQAQLWQEMRDQTPQKNQMIHVEFADFSNEVFFKLFDKYVVRNANSLGMNEQEMSMILDHWKGESNLQQTKNSQPSFEDVIQEIKDFFRIQNEMGLDISRVHLHPYGSFFICYDPKKWNDARDAILKSSLAVPHYCLSPDRKTRITKEADNFEISEMPEKFQHPNKEPGTFITLQKDKLLYDFDLNDDIHCYLQFFIKCKTLYKSAGIGDTISSTGFIYHVPK